MRRTNLQAMALILAAATCLPAPALYAQSPSNDVYQAVVTRDFGTAMAELEQIEKIIHDAKTEDYPAIEGKLIGILEAPGATMPGKQFALRMLRTVASQRCVPVVAKILRDKELAHMARAVLVILEGKEAGDALRDALADTQGAVRVGMINSLGDRRDPAYLQPLAQLLPQADADTTRALLNAIAKIGGEKAAEILLAAKAPEALQSEWAAAVLRCADGLAAGGQTGPALSIGSKLIEGPSSPAARMGAFRMTVLIQKEKSVPLVLQQLASNDVCMRKAAMAAVLEIPGREATQEFVRQLDSAPVAVKTLLMMQLAIRGDAEGATAAFNKLASDSNADVRRAAIQALERSGDATSVPVLAGLLKDATWQEPAKQALIRLSGKGVSEALIAQAESGDPSTRIALLDLLSERKQESAVPVARKAIADANADVRQAGIKILSRVGEAAELRPLNDLLLNPPDKSERPKIAGAISAIGSRMTDKATRCNTILETYGKADAETRALLIPVLATLAGDKALAATRTALTEAGPVRKAAIRALAGWKDASLLPDLRKIAQEETDEGLRIVALRGFIETVGASQLPDAEKVKSYSEAMGIATRAEEKSLVLAGAGKIAHADALALIAASLATDSLKNEAFLAYEQAAEALAPAQPALAKEALQKVADGAPDENLRKKAAAAIAKIK